MAREKRFYLDIKKERIFEVEAEELTTNSWEDFRKYNIYCNDFSMDNVMEWAIHSNEESAFAEAKRIYNLDYNITFDRLMEKLAKIIVVRLS